MFSIEEFSAVYNEPVFVKWGIIDDDSVLCYRVEYTYGNDVAYGNVYTNTNAESGFISERKYKWKTNTVLIVRVIAYGKDGREIASTSSRTANIEETVLFENMEIHAYNGSSEILKSGCSYGKTKLEISGKIKNCGHAWYITASLSLIGESEKTDFKIRSDSEGFVFDYENQSVTFTITTDELYLDGTYECYISVCDYKGKVYNNAYQYNDNIVFSRDGEYNVSSDIKITKLTGKKELFDNNGVTSKRIFVEYDFEKKSGETYYVLFRYRKANDTSYTPVNSESVDTQEQTASILINNDDEYDYYIKLIVANSNSIIEKECYIVDSDVFIDFKAGGTGIGIGKTVENDGLEIGFDTTFFGDVYIQRGNDEIKLIDYIKGVVNGTYTT